MDQNQKNWLLKPNPSEKEIFNLQNEVENLHPIIAALLYQRGLRSFGSIKSFFNSSLTQIDAFGEMKDQLKSAERLFEAVQEGEKILLYGDYDVDGTCSVSLMKLFLETLGADVTYYIPNRYSEGYGVSMKGAEFTISQGFDLMITLDCGISANTELEHIAKAGIDVIICDHHLPGRALPEVFAIMNPQQSDCPFEGKELCGAGVALMLVKSLSVLIKHDDLWRDYMYLAAIATCSDIVPLIGINRSIVSAGIEQINESCPVSIKALLDVAAYKSELDVSDVVFKIGPRINAAGRLKHAQLAVELLTSLSYDDALEYAKEVNRLNLQRRDLDKSVTAEALDQLRTTDPTKERFTTVVNGVEWNKGIIGIVASRLIEQCYRPTIVFAQQEEFFTGSARSIQGLNLFTALEACSSLTEKFGGHAMAAGLTIHKDQLSNFEAKFEKVVQSMIDRSELVPKMEIDLETDFSTWYNENYIGFRNQLNRMRPFGPKNMAPVFGTTKCKSKQLKVVGTDHLKFQVFQEHDPSRIIPVIAFGKAQYFDALSNDSLFDIAYVIGENRWNGKTSIQLEIKDIRLEN